MGASEREIEAVYRGRYVAFRNALTPLAGGADEARDAVQEAFSRALRQRRRFRRDGPLEAWIRRIALRTALATRRAPTAVELEEAVAEAPDLGVRRDPELAAAIAALPPRRRLVVFLRYFADLPYREIAALLGVSEGTVAATLSQAHTELASSLSHQGAVL